MSANILLVLCLAINQVRAGDALDMFTYECSKMAKTAESANQRAVIGDAGWLFLNSELVHLSKPVTAQSIAPSVRAITAFRQELRSLNVELVVVPVPAKAEMVAHRLYKKAQPLTTVGRMAPWFDALKNARVRTVDLAQIYREKFKHDELPGLYCQRDSHWSPLGARLAAERIFVEVKSDKWMGDLVAGKKFDVSPEEKLMITGDLLDEDHAKNLGPEEVSLTTVGIVKDGSLSPVASDPASPITLLADSHALVFSEGASSGFHCMGAGLVDHLQQQFGRALDLVASPGSGADNARMQLARKIASDPSYLAQKKLVIWCFAVREVTESQWKDIHLTKHHN